MSGSVDAVRRYVAQYESFAANGGGAAPAWVRDLRAAGIARFSEAGFPTTRQEEWRFTSVAPIVETPFAPAGATAVSSCTGRCR